MLLMWTSTLRGPLKPRKRLERPAGAGERQVSHVARTALRDAEAGELVVAPEGSVDEHDVACGEPAEHAVVQSGQAGRVRHDAATRAVAEDEPTGLKLHARPVQVARRVAACLERLDREARPLERPRLPWFQRLPLGPAVALQDLQHRIPAPQRLLDSLIAEDAHRRLRLTQEQEPGRMVDLRIGQQHARDRRRANAVRPARVRAPRAAGARPARRLRETTAPRHHGSPATTACEVAPARPRVPPRTSRSGSSTAETPRRRPSREYERARDGRSGRGLRQAA